jgi:hypothetical protein
LFCAAWTGDARFVLLVSFAIREARKRNKNILAFAQGQRRECIRMIFSYERFENRCASLRERGCNFGFEEVSKRIR